MPIVKRAIPAFEVDMGGIPVLQPLPTNSVEKIDPFLLLHHYAGTVQHGSHPRMVGVGPHPHRGFSPVTFIFKGDVHHRDSRGNSSIVKAGGVQWMNAGMGIIHSERPSKEFAKNGGDQEIIQLWINTPAALKMKEPSYQAVAQNDMPQLQGLAGEVRVVSGTFGGVKGPVKAQVPLLALMGELKPGDQLELSKKNGENAILYLLDGMGMLSGYGRVEGKTLYELNDSALQTSISVEQPTHFIYLSAQPLNEKVTQYGPYVMTTQTEILEAMRDYQMGKMGFLVEEF